jgi:hypothetical protein
MMQIRVQVIIEHAADSASDAADRQVYEVVSLERGPGELAEAGH